MISHKKIAEILKKWDLSQETIRDIYYEGTGNKNENACYVGENYVLKYTANLGKLRKNIEVAEALSGVGLLAAVPYIILANQFVCVAWFAEQEKNAEIFETNKQMTAWLTEKFDALRRL